MVDNYIAWFREMTDNLVYPDELDHAQEVEFWKKQYYREVDNFQEFMTWALDRIKELESCSPEAFEFKMEQERLAKIKLNSRLKKEAKNGR